MIERNCSVRKTIEVVLDTWTFLIIRESFFGVHNFDKLQRRLGIPRQTLSTRLNALVENEVLIQRQNKGERGNGYFFTERGLDLFPSMLSLMEFGDKWLTRGEPKPLNLVHLHCRHICEPVTVCSNCPESVNAWDVTYRDGPGAGFSPHNIKLKSKRSTNPEILQRVRPCSVARTLEIIGDRWSFLILREAWFGVRRFDEMTEKLGVATNILSDRLGRLVASGVFRKRPYRDGGDRFEYLFTKMGQDLYKPMIVMMNWGDIWLSNKKPPLVLHHRCCGSDFVPSVVCSHCRKPIRANEIEYTLNYTLDE